MTKSHIIEGPGPRITRAYVLHPDRKSAQTRRASALALEEAVALARALPAMEIMGAEVVRLPKAQAGLLFGSGKLEELSAKFTELKVDLVLIDGPVTPIQQRNLERTWKLKVLDRTGLILEIFADRARTREGSMQVELAALSRQRTRLVRAWTHLERQRGGLGFVGGPGETQMESDRRAIDEKVIRLKRALSKVVKTRELHRAARRKVPYPIVALVGYTNAGKSTLFNKMTGAEVMAKDMLFATLDPTMRAVELPSGKRVILSDTVGFISDLPTQLVAAFRATLEEVLEADLVLHVRDISHPETEEQAEDVGEILESLGVDEDVPLFEVWNKIDLLSEQTRTALQVQDARTPGIHAVSAVSGEGIEALVAAIAGVLDEARVEEVVSLPFAEGKRRAWLHAEGVIVSEAQTDEGYEDTVRWTERQKARFQTV